MAAPRQQGVMVPFRLSRKKDVDIIKDLDNHKNRSARIKQLLRQGMALERMWTDPGQRWSPAPQAETARRPPRSIHMDTGSPAPRAVEITADDIKKNISLGF